MVHDQPPRLFYPRKGSLDYPPFGLNYKTMHIRRLGEEVFLLRRTPAPYFSTPSTTAVTTAVIVHALPSGLAADDSGTAKPGTGVFVASPTNEAHGTRPDVLAIDIFPLAA